MTNPTTRTLGKDDWMTPASVFDPLHAIFSFTGDGCATDERASRLPRFISPEEDALSIDWTRIGPRVWLNPPYGRQIKKWFAKTVEQCEKGKVDTVVMLTFGNTDTTYWRDYVAYSQYCHQIVFLRPRVKFERPDGLSAVGAPKGSAVLVYRSTPRYTQWPYHCYADFTQRNWPLIAGLEK
jgi:phage N-6-adenine-methyltransferase